MKVLLPSRGCREKIWFFPLPEANTIGRMIKPFGMRRIQISFSKPPMLEYKCGEHGYCGQHALTKSEKMVKKR